MNHRLIAATIVAFLLAPAGTLRYGAAWAQDGPQPGRGQGRFHVPTPEERKATAEKIGITPQQQQEIENLYKRFEPVRSQFRDLNRQLWQEYRKWDFDKQKADSIRAKLLRLQKQMSDIRADNENHIRIIMTKEQFMKMQKIIDDGRSQRRQEDRGGTARPG